MRWLVALAVLAVLAAAFALSSKTSSSYALLVYPPYRLEMSLPFVAAAAVVAFVALYALVRVAGHTLRLPQKIRAFRVRRARTRARNAMDQAIGALFQGNYRRAEKFAALALKLQESPTLSAIVAARAAHAQRNFQARDSYLEAADTAAPEAGVLKLVTQVEFLLDGHRSQEALELLRRARALAPKNPALAKLEMRAHTLTGNWEQVLDSVSALVKLKEVDRDQLEPVRMAALKEALKLKRHDSDALKDHWKKLASSDRLDPGIAATAAGAFAALGMGEQARDIIERSLEKAWDVELAALYGEVTTEDTLRQIERAEGWLRQHPDDAALLLTLGKLCMRERLWGKAQSYTEASLALEPTREAHAAYAQLMERMGKPEQAMSYNRRRLIDQARE